MNKAIIIAQTIEVKLDSHHLNKMHLHVEFMVHRCSLPLSPATTRWSDSQTNTHCTLSTVLSFTRTETYPAFTCTIFTALWSKQSDLHAEHKQSMLPSLRTSMGY